MPRLFSLLRAILPALLLLTFSASAVKPPERAAAATVKATIKAKERRLLYAAAPGIRNYLEFGGHGLLVFDMDDGHRFVKRIPLSGLDANGKPLNVKGIVANAKTGRVYVTTTQTMTCLDLVTEKILWEKAYEGGCDRMAMTPDGKTIYLPSFEKDHWHVVDAMTGEVITKITPKSGAHNGVRRGHRDAHHRQDRRPVQRAHPPLHRQRLADARLRQRQRPARL
jgi:hypothetical protein